MIWRIAAYSLCGMFSIFVWANLGANAAEKDQTQGQKDAHLLSCLQTYYACIGGCSQATSGPLSKACTDGCDGRYNACKAAASVVGPATLSKQFSK
jgi:hypothetical protein